MVSLLAFKLVIANLFVMPIEIFTHCATAEGIYLAQAIYISHIFAYDAQC